jgi:protein TonB
MTASVELRARHESFLRVAFLCAALIHVVIFVFWPKYVPSVYRLTVVKIPEWIDIEPERVIPPAPKETELPKVAVKIEASDDVNDDETVPPTSLDYEDLARVPTEPPALREDFVAFDTPPTLRTSVKPVYPEIARRAEVEGSVTVLVTIDESGRVIDAQIAKSDASVFDEAALEAAYKFVFWPALQRDIPVKARIALPFKFSLTD